MIGKVSKPYLNWGRGQINPSLNISVSNLLKKKLAPSLDRMVVLAKQFDTQSLRTLFGLGQGGGREINPSLDISVSNLL